MIATDFYTIEREGISVTVDLRAGHLRSLLIMQDGRTIEPLHTAPWVGDTDAGLDETIPQVLRSLSGDFFCAPFGDGSLDNAPIHGWPANSRWRFLDKNVQDEGATTVRFELERRVLGAQLIKELSLLSHHPFLYQRHIFIGGEGSLPVANHAMTRFDSPGTISFSPKLYGELPRDAVESDPSRGHSILRYPAQFSDLTKVPTADGDFADLTSYPIAGEHEEFLALIEKPENPIGWSAALRLDKGDAFISLKNPSDFPITMVWISNGGRYYAPWNGRHRGVLGLEEGRTSLGFGHADLSPENPWRRQGIATALALDPQGRVEVRNVIGGVALPADWSRIEKVEPRKGALEITEGSGQVVSVPFDDTFLQ